MICITLGASSVSLCVCQEAMKTDFWRKGYKNSRNVFSAPPV